MPKPRKRNSLLALAFRRPKYWQGYRSAYDACQRYYLRVEENRLIKYYPAYDEFEIIPIKPPTLQDLGLVRLPSGKIIPKWNGGEFNG
ncbi:MAG: hypothetical protein ACE5K2_08355 [Candidatus Zixiibacteriota bacterium]